MSGIAAQTRVTHVNRKYDPNVAMDDVLTPIFRFLPTEALDKCSAADITDLVWAYRGGGAGIGAHVGVAAGGAPPWTREEMLARVEVVMEARKTLARLRAIPYIPQRSDEWFNMRKQRLTASDAAQAIGKGKYGTRAMLVKKKVNEGLGIQTPFKSSPPTQWGVMFEPMASRAYSQHREGVTLHEFGLLAHPELTCFGASPDNVSEMGVMVEYKCPYKRAITGDIPFEYQVQMQGQMAVCALTECDYVECGMERIMSAEAYIERLSGHRRHHGVILEWAAPSGSDAFCGGYDYSDADMLPEEAAEWAKRTIRESAPRRVQAIIYWRLKVLHITRVYFKPAFWNDLVPQIIGFWDDVVRGREEAIAAGPVAIATTAAAAGGGAGGAGAEKQNGKKYSFLEDSDAD